jgi:hypothetical protein
LRACWADHDILIAVQLLAEEMSLFSTLAIRDLIGDIRLVKFRFFKPFQFDMLVSRLLCQSPLVLLSALMTYPDKVEQCGIGTPPPSFFERWGTSLVMRDGGGGGGGQVRKIVLNVFS